MADVTEPRWFNETQRDAWRGLRAVVFRALPEMERTLKAHDLLGVHFQVLAALAGAPDQTRRLSELAEAANLSQSRLTHRLRTLIERGEVCISEDPDDRRAKNATLTDAGRKRFEHIQPIHIEDVIRLIFDPLSAEQTEALADAMSTIAAHVCQHPEFLNPRGR